MNKADLESLLANRFGWQLEAHGVDATERAIKQRLLSLEICSESEYLNQLQPHQDEFQALLEELIVPESWFFREREAIVAATQLLLAKYREKHLRPLRILCAPCSRGEEPTSLAISLIDSGLAPQLLSIDAIDLSSMSLEHARRGVYTSFSFRGDDLKFRDTAFEAVPGGWRIKDRYRGPINYKAHNVLELPQSFKGYDVIFCRNLLIYLTDSARSQMFHSLYKALLPEGALFLAACEFALPPSNLFTSIQSGLSRVFRKSHGNYLADLSHARSKNPPPQIPNPNPKPPPSRPIRPLTQKGLPHATGRAGGAGATRQSQILDLAEKAADQGQLEEALRLCQEGLQDGPSSRAYFLLAVITGAQNKNQETETNLRRALYLQPDHQEALAQLALCREKAGDLEGSRRLRERMKR